MDMSIFDKPGVREILREWNSARESRISSLKECEEARERDWKALVRMAEAHKHAIEVAGPEYAHLFVWPNALYGDRDEILAAAITGS